MKTHDVHFEIYGETHHLNDRLELMNTTRDWENQPNDRLKLMNIKFTG